MKDIVFSYVPYAKQLEIHQCKKRFKLICAGRRSGKTTLAIAELLSECYSGKYTKYDDIAWIAPTFQIAERGLDTMKKLCQKNPDAIKINNTAPKTITLLNDVRIKFLSADSPDRLRGYGFSLVVVDEADYIEDYVWTDVLRPALSDKQGKMIAISTPRRKGTWFHKLYLRGLEENRMAQSFHMASIENPYMSPEEIEEARLGLPEDSFLREYCAEYTDGTGEVFSGIDKCIIEGECNCKSSDILGVDLAKHEDFTVITKLCEKCHRIKEMHRYNKVDWSMNRKYIKNVYINSITPVIYIDSTGLGDVIFDDLLTDGLNIRPYRFSNASKQKLINNLRLLIMQGSIKWSPDIENALMFKYELECYQIEKTKTGLITYNAPKGIHDDCVISAALACQGLKHFVHPSGGITDTEKVRNEEDMWIESGGQGYDFGDGAETFFA